MTTNREKLVRLAAALAADVDRLSDEEIRAEVKETHGSVEQAADAVRANIAAAIARSGKLRLVAARKAYDAQAGARLSGIAKLPMDRKRALLEQFASNDRSLKRKLTMAARKEENSEADIDSLLEDLVQLDMIDEQGNPK